MCKRVSVYVSVYVCCTHLFSFFPLAFVLVNDLSLVSGCFLFWKCVRFCVCFCCRLFLFVVFTCILCLLPCLTRYSVIDVLSSTPTGVSEINYLTCLEQCLESAVHPMGSWRQGWGLPDTLNALFILCGVDKVRSSSDSLSVPFVL